MLMCVGVILALMLVAGTGIAVSLLLGYLILSTDPSLRLSRLSLSVFCGAAIIGMIAYGLSLDSLRAAIVFFDDVPDFVHVVMLVLAGAGSGWLLLRALALMFRPFRAQQG